jgi:hypothetical protein
VVSSKRFQTHQTRSPGLECALFVAAQTTHSSELQHRYSHQVSTNTKEHRRRDICKGFYWAHDWSRRRNARLVQACDWPKHQIMVVNTPHKIMDQGTILCLSGCPLLPCKTVLSIPTCASLSKSVTSQLCEATGSCSVNWQKLRTSPRSYRISLGWLCCFGRSGSKLGLLCTPFLLFTSCADALYNPQSRPRV